MQILTYKGWWGLTFCICKRFPDDVTTCRTLAREALGVGVPAEYDQWLCWWATP